MRGAHLLSAFAVLLGSCGGGAAGEAVRPDAPTASRAMGEDGPDCGGVAHRPEPLVVDWRSSDRADLEVAMKDGIAVVHYGCDGFRLLKACSAKGAYGFAGVRRKEDVVTLKGADELHANLPVAMASLKGDVARGATVDLALVIVGKRRAAMLDMARGDLVGDCDGATHVVRAAAIGAFALATDATGKVASVAELFGAGTGGASSSERKAVTKDGDPKACLESKSSDEEPPELCGSVLRVELAEVSAERKGEAAAPRDQPQALDNPCAEGEVLSEGKCTRRARAGYRCAAEDTAECKAQCDLGNGDSCFNLSLLVSRGGQGGVAPDREHARALADKACSLGSAQGCAGASYFRETADPERISLLSQACDMGDATSCRVAGGDIARGDAPGTVEQARRLLERGCRLHDRFGCVSYAWWHVGKGDWKEASHTLERGCADGEGDACALLGAFNIRCAFGRVAGMSPGDVPVCKQYPSPKGAVAARVFGAACENRSMPGVCQTVARMLREGKLVKKDGAKAARYYEIGCDSGGYGTCGPLADMLEKGDGIPKNLPRALEILERGCPEPKQVRSEEMGRACLRASALLAGGGAGPADPARAALRLEWSCQHGYLPGCDAYGAKLERDGKRDAAVAIYKDHCERLMDEPMCKAWVRLGGTLGPSTKPYPRHSGGGD